MKGLLKILICITVIFCTFINIHFMRMDCIQNLHAEYNKSIIHMKKIEANLSVLCYNESNKDLKLNLLKNKLKKRFPFLDKKYFFTKEYKNMTIKEFEDGNYVYKNFVRMYVMITRKKSFLEKIMLYNYKPQYNFIGLLKGEYKFFLNRDEILKYNQKFEKLSKNSM